MSFVDRRPDFGKFDDNGGRFVLTWNWFACVFGPLWYLLQGMWPKAVFYFFAISIVGAVTGGVGWLIGFVLLGAVGNYDLYLLRRRNTQLWSSPTEQANHIPMTPTLPHPLPLLGNPALNTTAHP